MLALCLMLLATYYAQNYAGIIGWSLNYACSQALVNKTLTWQSNCVIANYDQNQQNLFVQGYNHTYLKVHVVRNIEEEGRI